jgi:hypothetical protein
MSCLLQDQYICGLLTSFLSRRFSRSSALTRLASEDFIPSYWLRQR